MSEINFGTYGNVYPCMDIHRSNHTPSWKKMGDDGFAHLKVVAGHAWIDLTLDEGSSKSTRTTMLTLSPDEAVALRDFLVKHVKETHKAAA